MAFFSRFFHRIGKFALCNENTPLDSVVKCCFEYQRIGRFLILAPQGKDEEKMYDVIIIGAGVSGAAAARELSRYRLKVCVLEKEEDVCCGTSKANSALVHSGYDAAHGSLMAKLNVAGSAMMEELSLELDFPYKRIGSLMVCTSNEDLPQLQTLYSRGIQNGVKGLSVITGKEEIREIEPNLADDVVAVLHAASAGIVCPFGLNIAMAENAAANGVEFFFDTKVERIFSNKKEQSGFQIKTSKGIFETRCIVNAAGVYADVFHNMVSNRKIHITARAGEYCLLDKSAGEHVNHTVFALPTKLGKGVLVSPTIHGNLLVGPTAVDIEDKEDTATTREGLTELIEKAGMSVRKLPIRQVITSFTGLRAHEDNHDFLIGELPDAPGFVDCAGIESPGLTASPAIGLMVADIIREKLQPEVNPDFNGRRTGILNPNTLSKEERAALIAAKPAYGNVICRCETVTEGEIIDAIRRPLGAKSLDGVKRRVRAGMGRCQAGFCSPRVMEILSRELGIDMKKVTKNGAGSELLLGTNKDRL